MPLKWELHFIARGTGICWQLRCQLHYLCPKWGCLFPFLLTDSNLLPVPTLGGNRCTGPCHSRGGSGQSSLPALDPREGSVLATADNRGASQWTESLILFFLLPIYYLALIYLSIYQIDKYKNNFNMRVGEDIWAIAPPLRNLFSFFRLLEPVSFAYYSISSPVPFTSASWLTWPLQLQCNFVEDRELHNFGIFPPSPSMSTQIH